MTLWEKSIRPRLSEIRKWVSEGKSHSQIAKQLGVSASTLCRLIPLHLPLAEALGCADDMDQQVEQALYRIATGQTMTDCTWEMKEDKTKEGVKRRFVMTKKIVRQQEPSLAACKMWLLSRAGGRWKEEAAPAQTLDVPALLSEARQLLSEMEGVQSAQGKDRL